MKLGLCTIAFREMPIFEVIDLAAEYGFDGIEVWGQPPHMPENYDAEYVKEIKKRTENRDLEIVAFGSYIDPLMKFHQQHFENAFKIAEGLGAKIVRVWSARASSKTITPDDRRSMFFRFVTLAQWAQFRELTLGVEMHDNTFTDSITSVTDLLSYVKNPALKTYFQPSFRSGADDAYEIVDQLGKEIVNVHAQNADSSGNGCAIADGVVDYGGIVRKLADHGYDGYLEIEFLHGDDKLSALERDRDYLAGLIGMTDISQIETV